MIGFLESLFTDRQQQAKSRELEVSLIAGYRWGVRCIDSGEYTRDQLKHLSSKNVSDDQRLQAFNHGVTAAAEIGKVME
jgi:hypothetical protein